MGDAAEIEDRDRVQRILPLRVENAVIDERDERVERNEGGQEEDRRSFQIEAHGPNDIGGKKRRRDHGIGPQQHAECDQQQRQGLKRQGLKRQGLNGCAQARGPIGRGKGEHRRGEPNDGEQDVAPDHPDEKESRRREREQHRRKPESDRAPRRNERERAEGEPIQRGREQKHARRAGRDRIDQPPEQHHRGRLPIAEVPGHGVGIDIAGIDGAVAGIEDQHGEGIGGRQREKDKQRGPLPRGSLVCDRFAMLNGSHQP